MRSGAVVAGGLVVVVEVVVLGGAVVRATAFLVTERNTLVDVVA